MIEEISLGGDRQAGLRWLLVSESQKIEWIQAKKKAEGKSLYQSIEVVMDTARKVSWNLFIGNV